MCFKHDSKDGPSAWQRIACFIEQLSRAPLTKIKKIKDFEEWLHRPVDAASLGVCRMLFGLVMLVDIAEERGGAAIFDKWNNPRLCHFPLFPGISAMDPTRMGLVYAIMWIGAFGIFVGYKFRITSIMFSVSYWYLFLVDRSVWNNHSYLYGLCGLLFMTSHANRYCSVDSWLYKGAQAKYVTVPYWNYFIIKFQFCVLYCIAGLKKLSLEWLSGYAMSDLSQHWVFWPFRITLGADLTDLLIVHYFTSFFDLTIAIWMMWAPLRPWASLFCAAFHLMNINLFSIGMFPWLCLTQMPLFFNRDWPRKCLFNKKGVHKIWPTRIKKAQNSTKKKTKAKSIDGRRIISCFVLAYCSLQVFLPYSHSLTPGYNTWTEGPYGYSWDMMIHAWTTVRTSVRVHDNVSNKDFFLDAKPFTYTDRWSKHADMAHQFAKCIKNRLVQDLTINRKSPLKSNNISIYFDVWCSLNGRFQQRIFNPHVDILNAAWSPWQPTQWVLPIISSLISKRSEMQQIRKSVNVNYTANDILFVADFPGFEVEHRIPNELKNVSLTVMQGEVVLINCNSTTRVIKTGMKINIDSGDQHIVRTLGNKESGTMYEFFNQTLRFESYENMQNVTSVVSYMWMILFKRYENYTQFLRNIIYSVLVEILEAFIKIFMLLSNF